MPDGFSEWLTLILQMLGAAATAATLVWKFLKWYFKDLLEELKKAIWDEVKERKERFNQIEERVQNHAQLLHNYMGAYDNLIRELHEKEISRLSAVHEMQQSIERKLGEIRIEIARMEKRQNRS